MNYELAKELKDAGWPQLGDGYALVLAHETEDGERLISRFGWEKYCVNAPHIGPAIYGPTLSELIEACGDGFGGLWGGTSKGYWCYKLPQDPFRPHEIDMPHCWCNPQKKVQPNGNMVIVHEREELDRASFESPNEPIHGPTPEEAVARLWLALNKHE